MSQPTRPNILYLHSHDTGRYIQPYGYAVPTPRLQQFVNEAILFRHAFTVSPTCSPSRSALLTGSWPHCNGMTGLAHRGSKLINDYRQHLIHMLKPLGYHTALCGEQHIADDGRLPAWQTIGYDEMVAFDEESEGAHETDRVDLARARGAVAFLERQRDRPFFLSVGFFTTHRTKAGFNDGASPGENPCYARPPAHLPDAAPLRQDFADFTVAAGRLDRYMGMVLDALDRAGLRDNTLVIVTTDHGIAFPGMKCNLADQGLGVMLMLRGPLPGGGDGSKGGRVIDAMVTHMDLFPTVCDLLRIPHPAWLQGKSLLPLLTGEAQAIHDAVFAEINYHAAYEPVRAVRTERYKYIRRFDVRPHPVLPNVDGSPSKEYLLDNGWGRHGQEEEQLFDLVFDPEERCSRARDPDCRAALQDMRRRLDDWMHATRDPLLTGRVAPWPAYKANAPTDPSPAADTAVVVE